MSTEQEVIALVAKRTGRPESSITPEKTFYQLGIVSAGHMKHQADKCEHDLNPTAPAGRRKRES
jgi:hypothetical protein